MSHRASLNRKKPDYYTYDVGDYANWGYIWPTKVEAFYRTTDPPLERVCEPLKIQDKIHTSEAPSRYILALPVS
jgi:hypothetical protein